MEKSFWIPILVSLLPLAVSLLVNFIQNRKILKLQTEANRKNLIHKVQFEKEFNIYTELWAKLIDLRNATATLRPIMDFVPENKTEEEIKTERLQEQWRKSILLIETFEKNSPFYSISIYNEIKTLINTSHFEAIEYKYQERNNKEYWQKAEENINKIVNAMDKISNLIRERIEVVEVTG